MGADQKQLEALDIGSKNVGVRRRKES